MATDLFYRVTAWIYTALSVSILATWSLFVLALTATTALSKENDLITLIATPSLLTWLVSRLILAARPSAITAPNQNVRVAQDDVIAAATASATVISDANPTAAGRQDDTSLAQWIASADNGSPHGALVLFLFACTWLAKLMNVMLNLFLLLLMVLFYALAMFLSTLENVSADSMAKDAADISSSSLSTTTVPSSPDQADGNLTTLLVGVKNETGLDLEFLVEAFPPWLLLQLVLGVSAMVIALTGYVAVYGYCAFKLVLNSPREAWTRGLAPQQPQNPIVVLRPQTVEAAVAQQNAMRPMETTIETGEDAVAVER